MQAIIDRFEGEKAVVRTNGQDIIVPRAELPKDIKEGSALFIIFSQSKTEEETRGTLAKTILNEILNDKP